MTSITHDVERDLTGAGVREMRTEVVVAGAGPVGLMLAGELRRARVPVVVVERLAQPMTESRASLLTTLTAELLHERGFDSLLAEAGYEPGTHFGGLPFDVSDVDSDYAGTWKVPQYRTENVLGRRAAELGATLLRAHELTEVSASDEQVACVVRGPGDDMLIRARYLVGCDGAASTVRRCRGFTSSVTSATKELIRADVTGIEIPDRRFERREHGFAAASTRDGVTRVMVHAYGQEVAGRTEPPRFPEVVRLWQQVTGEDIAHGVAIWIDAFDNSTGLADSYRQGRVFLAGDAAHWHMPIGGQALNVGLQDAVNLGWKLAATVNGWADAGLLDSYHDERHPVAKRVLGYVAAQELLLIGGREYDPLRTVLAELIGLDQVRGHLARVVSGLDDRYGSGGSPLAGRRIRNVTPRTAYHALAAAGLLAATEPVLVLGSSAADGPAAPVLPGGHRLRVVHVQPGGNGSAARNSAVLVRPDGYIAWAGDDVADLNQAIEPLFGVQPMAAPMTLPTPFPSGRNRTWSTNGCEESMPTISPASGYLTVLNQFYTDTAEKTDSLIKEMCRIVDAAAYPGWISSSVHRGVEKFGTLNFIQWRGREDLETRYAADEFKHHTVPIFKEITTSVRLMQNEVELAQRHPSLGDVTEISPDRGDYTAVDLLGVAPAEQDELIAAVGAAHEWLVETPGYRSQTVLRGIRARGPSGTEGNLAPLGADNDYIVVYRQWDSREAFDAFRAVPDDQQPAARRATQAVLDRMTTFRQWNTYRVVHTRSASPVAAA